MAASYILMMIMMINCDCHYNETQRLARGGEEDSDRFELNPIVFLHVSEF